MMNIFSDTEQKILKILGKKKMTIAEITEEFYKDTEKVLNPNIHIGGSIRRINQKCAFYLLDWKLEGEGLGRGGRTVWKEELL